MPLQPACASRVCMRACELRVNSMQDAYTPSLSLSSSHQVSMKKKAITPSRFANGFQASLSLSPPHFRISGGWHASVAGTASLLRRKRGAHRCTSRELISDRRVKTGNQETGAPAAAVVPPLKELQMATSLPSRTRDSSGFTRCFTRITSPHFASLNASPGNRRSLRARQCNQFARKLLFGSRTRERERVAGNCALPREMVTAADECSHSSPGVNEEDDTATRGLLSSPLLLSQKRDLSLSLASKAQQSAHTRLLEKGRKAAESPVDWNQGEQEEQSGAAADAASFTSAMSCSLLSSEERPSIRRFVPTPSHADFD